MPEPLTPDQLHRIAEEFQAVLLEQDARGRNMTIRQLGIANRRFMERLTEAGLVQKAEVPE